MLPLNVVVLMFFGVWLQVWNLTNCKLKTSHHGHKQALHTVTVSPDGSLCASGGMVCLYVWCFYPCLAHDLTIYCISLPTVMAGRSGQFIDRMESAVLCGRGSQHFHLVNRWTAMKEYLLEQVLLLLRTYLYSNRMS